MGELTFWEKVGHLLRAPGRWTQCKHMSGCSHDIERWYCQRRLGHFGPHRYHESSGLNPPSATHRAREG